MEFGHEDLTAGFALRSISYALDVMTTESKDTCNKIEYTLCPARDKIDIRTVARSIECESGLDYLSSAVLFVLLIH